MLGRSWLFESAVYETALIASHFELSSAEVSQAMSLVRSLLSLLVLSGCK